MLCTKFKIMRQYFITILLTITCFEIFSQSLTQSLLPNENTLRTTYNIFTDTLSGTCFAITYNNKEYITTAKHLFKKNTKSGDSVFIKININNIETKYKAQVFFHTNTLIDVAILKLPKTISQTPTLPMKGGESYFMGQECIFLGYPLFNIGSIADVGKIAFIKRAIISAFYEENGVDFILLDGHNNPGFSGGPIITYSDKMDNQFIVGIIGGYINQTQEIPLKSNNTDSLQQSIKINENSGIIIAYPAKYILETLKNIN